METVQISNFHAIDADRENLLLSVRNALSEPVDPEAASIGLECVHRLAGYMWQRGLWREWEPETARAISVATALGDEGAVANLLSYRAGLFYALGEWLKALRLARHALEVSNTPKARAAALYRIGCASHDLGKHKEARKALEEALTLVADVSTEMEIKHKLYRVYRAAGSVSLASSLLDETLKWAIDSGDNWLRAEMLLDRASDMREEDPVKALRLVEESAGLYRDMSFPRGSAYADLELGRIACRNGNEETATEALAKARCSFDAMNYRPGLAHVFYAFGQLELRRRRYIYAMKAFESSGSHANAVGYLRLYLRSELGICLSCFHGHRWLKFLRHTFIALYLIAKARPPMTILVQTLNSLKG